MIRERPRNPFLVGWLEEGGVGSETETYERGMPLKLDVFASLARLKCCGKHVDLLIN